MPNEITINVSLSVVKNSLQSVGSKAFQVTLTSDQQAQNVQTLTAGAATIVDVSGVTPPGYFYLANLDATNYIEIGFDNVITTPMKLLPGAAMLIPGNTAGTLYAKAHTGNCELAVVACGV